MAADMGLFGDVARQAMAKLLRVELERLVPEASLSTDLRVDSLEFIALVVGLERQFDVDLPDAAVAQIRTVSEMIEFLRMQMSGAPGADAVVWPAPLLFRGGEAMAADGVDVRMTNVS